MIFFGDLRSLITSGADFMNLVIYNMVSSSKIFVNTCYRILSPTVRDFMDAIYLFWVDMIYNRMIIWKPTCTGRIK